MAVNLTDPYSYDTTLYHTASAAAQTVGIIVNVTTIWLIISHSPGEMSTYKWHLLYFTVLGAYMDIHLDVFISGVIYLPLPCGTLSCLARSLLDLSTFTGLVWSIIVIAEMSVCTCHLFIYRLQVVLPHSSALKIKKEWLTYVIVVYHILWDIMILILSYFALYVESQDQAREVFVKDHPEIGHQAEVDGFFVSSVSSSTSSMVAMTLLLLTILVCGALNGFCSFYSFKLLERMTANMSGKTRAMHANYMKALIAQITFPTIVIALPGIWIMLCILLQWGVCRNQNLSNLLMVSIGWHGACSSILIMVSNGSYRTKLSRLLFWKQTQPQSNIATFVVVNPKSLDVDYSESIQPSLEFFLFLSFAFFQPDMAHDCVHPGEKKCNYASTSTRPDSSLESRELVRPQIQIYSYTLRHHPESIGLQLDDQGWADVDRLLFCANKKGRRIDRDALDDIVRLDNKQRFSYSDDGNRIRAAQGHSSKTVKINYDAVEPPRLLYHGTADRFLASILEKGLIPGSRHHVHLSADEVTARTVGARHGRAVVLRIEAGRMFEEGFQFHRADNGVWLTDHVPVKYISQ